MLRVIDAPDKCGRPQKLSVCTRTRRADVQLQGVSAVLDIGHLPYETWVMIIPFALTYRQAKRQLLRADCPRGYPSLNRRVSALRT